MKSGCVIMSVLIAVAIMAVCVMVKFATDINVEEKKRASSSSHHDRLFEFHKTMGVISLNSQTSQSTAERFPYVAAVIRNSSRSYTFACFASLILAKWIVTSAHCRQLTGKHRVLLYLDYLQNQTHTYPVLFWRVHELYNTSHPLPRYDISVAKLNIEQSTFQITPSYFNSNREYKLEASVWKTISTMNKELFLTNDFEVFSTRIMPHNKCFEAYGIEMNESMICVDMSEHEDCFLLEFGPLYTDNKVVGVLAKSPSDCDLKLVIFTNVSYYSDWISKITT